jgi:hypothetical protein
VEIVISEFRPSEFVVAAYDYVIPLKLKFRNTLFIVFFLLLFDRSRLISIQQRPVSEVMEVLQEHRHHIPEKMLQTLGYD